MKPQEHTIIGRDMIDGVLIHFGAGCIALVWRCFRRDRMGSVAWATITL